ncbi:MAG TPA: type II secretion system F family protein [Ilumatobacteraceae bacterium]
MNALLSATVALIVIGATVPLAAPPARRPSHVQSPDPARRIARSPHATSPRSTTPPAPRSPVAVAARASIAMTALVAGVSVIGPSGAIAIGLVTLVVRTIRRRRRQRQQQVVLDTLVPELIELVLVGVHAGLTAPQAMLRLSTIAPLPLRPALEALESRLRGGDRFTDALEALSERGGPAYRPLVFTLALAERTGDPIASVLDRLADEARRHRRRLADASARELPVRLAVPLVSCTLPAFVLLTIAPVLAGALSSLAGSLP